MRFRFCGDLDCPDWILAEVNTLSKMSNVKMKILCQVVAKSLGGDGLDEEKAKKLILEAKLGEDDMKACVAVLFSILTLSARHSVDEAVLLNEMQQLGLPKENATALSRVYTDTKTAITSDLISRSLRLTTLESVTCDVGDNASDVKLTLHLLDRIRTGRNSHEIAMSPQQLLAVLSELKNAKQELDALPNSPQ